MSTRKVLLWTGSFLGCLAVLLQLFLIIENRTTSILETLMRFFSYFTILSNILVTIYFTTIAFFPASRLGRICTTTFLSTAVTAYILLVGIAYQLLLRHIWNPQGLQGVADELLHTVIPLFVFLYWLLYVPGDKIPWKSVFTWGLYPVLYFSFILLRGALFGFYPYYFIDVSQIGYAGALKQSLIMLLAFFALAGILIFIKGRQKQKNINPLSS